MPRFPIFVPDARVYRRPYNEGTATGCITSDRISYNVTFAFQRPLNSCASAPASSDFTLSGRTVGRGVPIGTNTSGKPSTDPASLAEPYAARSRRALINPG